jgi:hypothetical protein
MTRLARVSIDGRESPVAFDKGYFSRFYGFRRWYLHVPMRTFRSIAPAVGLLLRRREAPERGTQQ